MIPEPVRQCQTCQSWSPPKRGDGEVENCTNPAEKQKGGPYGNAHGWCEHHALKVADIISRIVPTRSWALEKAIEDAALTGIGVVSQ